jgi:hypothetical protein
VEAPESYRDEIMAIQQELPRKKYIAKDPSS